MRPIVPVAITALLAVGCTRFGPLGSQVYEITDTEGWRAYGSPDPFADPPVLVEPGEDAELRVGPDGATHGLEPDSFYDPFQRVRFVIDADEDGERLSLQECDDGCKETYSEWSFSTWTDDAAEDEQFGGRSMTDDGRCVPAWDHVALTVLADGALRVERWQLDADGVVQDPGCFDDPPPSWDGTWHASRFAAFDAVPEGR